MYTLQCMSDATSTKQVAQVASSMAAFFLQNPACDQDDIAGAYEEAVHSEQQPQQPIKVEPQTSAQTAIDTIGELLVRNGTGDATACILQSKTQTLVISPTADQQRYRVLNVETKQVLETQAPEYDVQLTGPLVEAHTVVLAPAAEPEPTEPEPMEIDPPPPPPVSPIAEEKPKKPKKKKTTSSVRKKKTDKV